MLNFFAKKQAIAAKKRPERFSRVMDAVGVAACGLVLAFYALWKVSGGAWLPTRLDAVLAAFSPLLPILAVAYIGITAGQRAARRRRAALSPKSPG